ncbi:MAG: hypothetical protein IIZ92_24895 [Aquincola sp.]|nr:hypothetical protein [Aquincola sp.]
MLNIRPRHWYMAGGSAAVLGALFFTDPDQGIGTGLLLLAIVTPVLAVLFAHISRKALHDYPEADMQTLFKTAGQSPTGAGLALVALAITLSALLGLFGRSAHAQPVPDRALQLMPVLATELRTHWPDAPMPAYVPALIEHESCITLRHPRCWSPTAQLRTAREEGAGLGQITRAWRPDGSQRFDALQELRDRHPALRELDWRNVYQRPDLQLRAVVLKSRDGYQALRVVAHPIERLAMADAAYNGGLTGLQRERRACQLATACDPGRWFGNVERHCLKSREPLYAGRSACDINRHHVRDVLLVRAPRYEGLL